MWTEKVIKFVNIDGNLINLYEISHVSYTRDDITHVHMKSGATIQLHLEYNEVVKRLFADE